MRKTALVLILISGNVFAQQRPDFSGTWTAQFDPAARPAPVLVYGQQFSIDHKGDSLRVTRNFTGGPATIDYRLDGSEINNRMPGRLCEPDSGGVWTASWNENALAINMIGAVPPNGKPIKMDVKAALKFESTDALSVSVTSMVAGQPRTNTMTYKRSAAAPASASTPQVQETQATLTQMEWLSGIWIGTTGTSTFEERWTPPVGGSMQAVARSVRDGIMNSFEFLCIVEREGGLVYQAMPNGRQPATDFTLTRLDANSATFENPTHDFPKMIRYTRQPDGSLEAVISGAPNQRPQTFTFKKAGQ